jgi:hypothetical protein
MQASGMKKHKQGEEKPKVWNRESGGCAQTTQYPRYPRPEWQKRRVALLEQEITSNWYRAREMRYTK